MSAQIVRQIVPLIRSGDLQPGDRLPSERDLAERFGVSRVTIRDALRVLEVMGLVEIKVGAAGGAFVTVPSLDVIGEGVANLLHIHDLSPEMIAEARLLLELAILRLVLERITDEDIRDLRAICEKSRSLLKAGSYDTKLSVQFHSRLARCARNGAVTLLAESFAGPLSMAAVRSREQRSNVQKRTVDEHEQLVNALEAGDHDAAVATLRAHLLRGLPDPEASNAKSSSPGEGRQD